MELGCGRSLRHPRPTGNLISGVRGRVMPSEQYFPMSGMNLAVRREAACLKEAPGIDANERMWERIDAVEQRGETPAACMRDLGLFGDGR
jgi:hypothetical protein